MNFWSFSFSFSFLVCFHSSLLRSIFSLSSFSWGKPAKLLFHPLVLDGSAVLPGSLRTGLPPPGKLSFPCPLLSTCPLEQLCLFWYPEVQLCSLSGTTGNFCRISLHLPRIPCTQQQQVKDQLSPFLGPWPKSPGSWHSMSVTRQEEKKKKKVEGEKHIWCSAEELVLLKGTLAIELRVLKVLQRTPQNWTRIFLGCSKVLKSYLCCLKTMPHERGTLCSITPLLCLALKD